MSLNEMQTPGAILRARRQARGITLEDVAARTRIRRLYLQALEEDRYDILPGEAYRTGFLRIYAELLDLDPTELVASPSPPPPPPKDHAAPPAPRSPGFDIQGKKTFLLVLGSVCLFFAAVLIAGLLRSSPPSEDRATVAEKTDTSLAKAPSDVPRESMEEPREENPKDENPIAEAPNAEAVPPSAESIEKPQIQTAAAQRETEEPSLVEAAAISPLPGEKTVSAPVEKSGVMKIDVETGILRAEAVGSTELVLQIEELDPRTYHLIQGAQLSWKFSRSARLHVADSAKVKLWIDHRPLDLSGRPELLLLTVMEP